MSISNVETLLTSEEVMGHLRIGKTNLYKLVNTGKLKATKIGAKTLFRASAVQAFIEQSEKQTPEPAKLVRDL